MKRRTWSSSAGSSLRASISLDTMFCEKEWLLRQEDLGSIRATYHTFEQISDQSLASIVGRTLGVADVLGLELAEESGERSNGYVHAGISGGSDDSGSVTHPCGSSPLLITQDAIANSPSRPRFASAIHLGETCRNKK